MFISLYTTRHLKKLKQNILLVGMLLVTGGAFAVYRELIVTASLRPLWFLASLLVLGAGGICIAVARDMFPLKDAYFLMNSSRLSYRLTLLGREQVLTWSEVAAVRVSDARVVFELRDEKEVTLQLSAIPDEQTARHIRASISLAALEQNIKVNGVLARPAEAVPQL